MPYSYPTANPDLVRTVTASATAAATDSANRPPPSDRPPTACQAASRTPQSTYIYLLKLVFIQFLRFHTLLTDRESRPAIDLPLPGTANLPATSTFSEAVWLPIDPKPTLRPHSQCSSGCREKVAKERMVFMPSQREETYPDFTVA